MLLSNVDDLLKRFGDDFFDKGTGFLAIIVIDFLHMSIESGQKLKLRYRGKELEIPEYFLPAVPNTDAFLAEKLLIAAGSKCLINLDEVAVARSKSATYGRLATGA